MSSPAMRLPEFDYTKCRGESLCVAVCPTDCLDMWNDAPWLLKPSACIDCEACVAVCPTGAVAMRGGTGSLPAGASNRSQ